MNFEAKVKYEKLDPVSGKNKVISEPYLLDAETFGDAEEKTLKYMADITSATVIATVKKSDIEDVVGDQDNDVFYKASVKLAIIDELSGKEKSETIQILAGNDSLKSALSRVEIWCDESMCDTEIVKISKSPIVGIF
jgi:hypothetical protein